MTKPTRPDPAPADNRRRWLRRFFSKGGRDHVWSFLDFLDARPRLKRGLVVGLPALALAVGCGAWGYHRWARLNAVRIAQQWFDAGKLDRASEAARDALANEPNLPDSYRISAKIAWQLGNRAAAVGYAEKAAELGREQPDDVLAWAEYAVLADDRKAAQAALASLDPALPASARALRLRGELARRDQRLADAAADFKAARDADAQAGVALAVDEVPLGIVEVQDPSPDRRADGRVLLERWAPDLDWGVPALRALLADAGAQQDAGRATQWAEALRAHPRCTLGDVPTCLQALARFNPEHYHRALERMEAAAGDNPTAAGQLLGWLNQIGQPAEAARWGLSLPPTLAHRPPAAQGVAEALRATQRWPDLRDWVAACDWGSDAAFLGYAYGYVAARATSDTDRADSLLKTLESDGHLNAAHALFAGDSLYVWGYPDEATRLLWLAAERPDLALDALGTLARLYQVRRDAVGEYHAFSRLNAIEPADRDIANNYAYFAAVTDLGSQTRIKQIAADNFDHQPDNLYYRSTYAFVLVWAGQTAEASKLMAPVSRDWAKSPAIAFAYGAVLATSGRAAEAQPVFDSLNPRVLSPQEIGWIRGALKR